MIYALTHTAQPLEICKELANWSGQLPSGHLTTSQRATEEIIMSCRAGTFFIRRVGSVVIGVALLFGLLPRSVAAQVPTGSYTVLAERSGFKATALSGVQVGVDSRVKMDVKLEVGQMTESVK